MAEEEVVFYTIRATGNVGGTGGEYTGKRVGCKGAPWRQEEKGRRALGVHDASCTFSGGRDRRTQLEMTTRVPLRELGT